tara:strand:+ start:278 stop:451 length:174 start_codon:yes stop_codon:yes gene_type:complete
MFEKMCKNLIVGYFVLVFLVSCSVAPDKTTLSATTKASTDAIPTVKAVQTFKWSKKE